MAMKVSEPPPLSKSSSSAMTKPSDFFGRLGHWMLIFLKRFTTVTTCHYQKTPGPSGTWKSRCHAGIRYFTTRCVKDFRSAMFQTRHRGKSCRLVTFRRQRDVTGVGQGGSE